MSYTHTLSIQHVNAILQMRVENAVVSYTLTLRADSGEEVVTNGRLPNDVMDKFIIIEQHVTNPVIPVPIQDSLSSDVKQTMEQGIQTTLTDLKEYLQYEQRLEESQMAQSHTNIDVPNIKMESSLDTETFSPILPSSPRNTVNLSFDETELQELQDIRERYVYERIAEVPKESKEEELKAEEPKEEEPKEEEPTYEEIRQRLDTIWSNDSCTARKAVLMLVRDHIAFTRQSNEKYVPLRNAAVDITKKMIKRYIYDTQLVDWCADFMVECLQWRRDQIAPFVVQCVSHYDLFLKLAKNSKSSVWKVQMNAFYTTYVEWKEAGYGSHMNRWKSMKYWWDNVRN